MTKSDEQLADEPGMGAEKIEALGRIALMVCASSYASTLECKLATALLEVLAAVRLTSQALAQYEGSSYCKVCGVAP